MSFALSALRHRVKLLHDEAHEAVFAYYLRKGVVHPRLVAIMQATSSLEAFATYSQKFNPDQPRVPAGSVGGGQWTSGDGGGTDAGSTQTVQEIPPIVDPEVAPIEPLPGIGDRPLPTDPNDLLDQGYQDISDPRAAAAGHRTFYNPDTGDTLRFDEGEPDEPGFAGQDHYHRINPDKTDPDNPFLDQNGAPVPKGSKPSHLIPIQIA